MAHKNENPGYMDGVPVKISEKYKPPKRIILPTNTPRLTASEILQGTNFSYDFTLEYAVKEKMKELREARAAIKLNRENRIKNYLEQKKEVDSTKRLSWHNNITSGDTDSTEYDLNTDIPNTDSVTYPDPTTIADTTCTTNTITTHDSISTVLMPTLMSNTSSSTVSYSNYNTSSPPINLSDFENDTASPFDNMELKTINDLAELAQVLQPGTAINTSPSYNTNASYNSNITDFNKFGAYATPHDNRPLNGYYVNNYLITNHAQTQSSQLNTQNSNLSNSFNYNITHESHANIVSPPQPNTTTTATTTTTEYYDNSKSRSVPDIINALQRELMQTRIEEANAAMKQTTVDKYIKTNVEERNSKQVKIEENYEPVLPNPYSSLSPRLQQISKEVSLMGFPLDRVARACAIIGDDQSRLIEHMISLSQLLDLGFTEENITKALLLCDNDRDKALDLLVT